MICSSRLYSSVGKSYVFSLLYKNLIAANLFSVGFGCVWYNRVSEGRFSVFSSLWGSCE